VERVLDVLDGAVLVVSSVEGVQAQTGILLRTLRLLRIPTLIFANKVDRTWARDASFEHYAPVQGEPPGGDGQIAARRVRAAQDQEGLGTSRSL
jgi:ribosomal protection tetracycline resistance protein